MSMEETVTINLDINASKLEDNVRRIEFMLSRVLSLLSRFTGDPNVDKIISRIQHLVMVIRIAHSAWIAFQTATGPMGWAFALISGLAAASIASDFVLSAGG